MFLSFLQCQSSECLWSNADRSWSHRIQKLLMLGQFEDKPPLISETYMRYLSECGIITKWHFSLIHFILQTQLLKHLDYFLYSIFIFKHKKQLLHWSHERHLATWTVTIKTIPTYNNPTLHRIWREFPFYSPQTSEWREPYLFKLEPDYMLSAH